MDNENYYIPLQTVNDVFFSRYAMITFLFNGEALFLAGDDQLFDYQNGDYSELAKAYYSVPEGPRSDKLAEYSYHELCLALDNLYGLKETHDISSFAQFFWEIGFDEVLSGNNAYDADIALKQVIDDYLDDLHSRFDEYSYLCGIQSIPRSTGITSRKFEDYASTYRAARAKFNENVFHMKKLEIPRMSPLTNSAPDMVHWRSMRNW